MDDLLAEFLTETNENLADLDVALVRLERNPDDGETLSLIFRLVHTIKGTCGFLGLPRLEKVAHAAENVLGRVRDGVLGVTPDLISTVLAAIDQIKFIVAELGKTGAEPGGDDAALILRLDAVSNGHAPPPAAAPAAAPPPAVAPPPAAVLPVLPAAAAAPVAAAAAEPPRATPEAAAEAPQSNQTIRLGVDVLEDLMTLVSELVLTRNQLLQLARSRESAAFSVPLQRLSHITTDLQEGVMKTRMQPIGNAWGKLPRLVRDLTLELDKRIELVMHGAETELDRQVLELIKDPLTHMVRNSADHGLETPAERRAAGKAETGHITLNAFHEGGHIVIEVGDDGRGLPVDKIRSKIISKGLATEAELVGMTDNQILRFIFRPGFSTAATITAVSGRGVGMDVVKTNVERIGGTIELASTAGQGTIFTIKIPLTLAIVSALIVEAGGERFAIPQLSVVELVRAGTEASAGAQAGEPVLQMINDTPVLRLRDRLLPLVNLADLLRLGTDPARAAEPRRHIVVAQVGASLLGIVVDRVFDTEEIVVKPVAPIMRHVTMFSGNTILGDGSVIMILDPNGIARATGIAGSADGRGAGGRPAAGKAGRSDERAAMLLFRAGGTEPKVVPLGLVARLEEIAADQIEVGADQVVTQYRGRLMPLIAMSGELDLTRPRQIVLVFADTERRLGHDRCMGLVVDEIIDVVEETLAIQLATNRPGILGKAVIAGKATDIIDAGYWLTRAFADWFDGGGDASQGNGTRLLIVEDSAFFRQMLVPSLVAAGFDVTAVGSAAEALALADAGVPFSAIVSDIEMPDMDGLAFVARLRAGGPWQELPVIALTGMTSPAQIEAGRAAGFTDYVRKFEREALLASLRQCLTISAEHRLHA
ncbi:MAG: chemotaxis protein CheW [Alphaproteobacteria bacterium]|nr:chemotaxis protein CheW [Alphaproteobacteria bacterium]